MSQCSNCDRLAAENERLTAKYDACVACLGDAADLRRAAIDELRADNATLRGKLDVSGSMIRQLTDEVGSGRDELSLARAVVEAAKEMIRWYEPDQRGPSGDALAGALETIAAYDAHVTRADEGGDVSIVRGKVDVPDGPVSDVLALGARVDVRTGESITLSEALAQRRKGKAMTDALIDKARELADDCDCPHCKCLCALITRLEAAEKVIQYGTYWADDHVIDAIDAWRAIRDAKEGAT